MVIRKKIELFNELPPIIHSQIKLIIDELHILQEEIQSLQVDMDQVIRKVRDVERKRYYFENKINEEMGF